MSLMVGVCTVLTNQIMQLIPEHQEESTTSVSPTSSGAVISSSLVNTALYDGLRGKIIGEALQLGAIQQVRALISMSHRDLTLLLHKIQNKDEIALIISTFPLLHCQPNGEYRPFAKSLRLGMALYVDVLNLYTLLDELWVSLGAIDGVLAELAVLSPAVQSMSSEKTFIHLCKLLQNGSVRQVDVIDIRPNTHTLVFPFNLSSNYWRVAKATCHKKKRLINV